MNRWNWGKYIAASMGVAIPCGIATLHASASAFIPAINSHPGQGMAAEVSQIASPIAQIDDDLTSQQLDGMADRIFNERHPELRGRKIWPEETWLAEEWKAIRRCEAVVDYTFYNRHPELGGRKIRPDEKWLAHEWQEIKDTVPGCR